MSGKMERKGTYPIEDVLIHVVGNINVRNKEKLYMELDGDRVKIRSDRLLTFKRKGCKCVKCGIEGKFFAKERFVGDENGAWHLNLYAVKNGQEILMTKDHIMPKSKGGADALYNFQPMCTICNNQKADTIPKIPRVRRKTVTECEAEIAKLNSILGGKDSTISKLTVDNRNLQSELNEKRKLTRKLQTENVIFKKRIEQLVRILMEPTPDPDELGNM